MPTAALALRTMRWWRRRRQVKLEVAKFLQDCVEDKAKKLKKSRSGEAAERSRELYKLVARVRALPPNTLSNTSAAAAALF